MNPAMDRAYSSAFILGYERMAAWSDLLDQINVFPVADADTGRNLKISLAPLRRLHEQPAEVSRQILRSATGNAGNIASAFFHELLKREGPSALPEAIQQGMQAARRAVANPKPGTMLTVFEVLSQTAGALKAPLPEWSFENIVDALAKCVSGTSDALPELRRARVVDAGALGMFIFLEAFLGSLTGCVEHARPVTDRFEGRLKIADDWRPVCPDEQYCVSAAIRGDARQAEMRRHLRKLGDSIVVHEAADILKVHLHTGDREALRSGLDQIGEVLDWSEERIEPARSSDLQSSQPVHIMTDAAGSVTREDAQALGMTLLDSYLVVGDQSHPETLYPPASLYAAMAKGQAVSTAQASLFQRSQSYLSVVSRYERVIYLCVGSAYTGNFEAAKAWQALHDPDRRLTVIDTGAASGRLGIAALASARYARQHQAPEAVAQFAHEAATKSQELVFLDQLKHLAAGGRISKLKGFFGDLLHMKPIITPTAHGAAKVGVARTQEDQVLFALKHLRSCFRATEAPLILLQYSDNRTWVGEIVAERIRSLLPAANILVRPLSLTSGAHMGPGAWAIAFLPEDFDR